jgi:uncharacterized membrane protein
MNELRQATHWLNQRSAFSVTAASSLAMAVFLLGPLLLGQLPSQRFLVWNLALAWIPYVAALGLEAFDRARLPLAAAATAAIWLLFLPNAPYLVTDLTHLHRVSATPWLELARFVAFAWAGCLLAVASLRLVHRVVSGHAGWVTGWAVVVFSAGVSGIGVVLGRFARLNSWEVVTNPAAVATEALRLTASRQGLAVAVFFTLLLLVIYAGLGGPAGGSRLGFGRDWAG